MGAMRTRICENVNITLEGKSMNHSLDWIDDCIGGRIGLMEVINITDKEIIDAIDYIKENNGYIYKYSGIIYFTSKQSAEDFADKLKEVIKSKRY